MADLNNQMNSIEAREVGMQATSKRKQISTHDSLAATKRRKLSPSPDILSRPIDRKDNHEVLRGRSPHPQKQDPEDPTSISSSPPSPPLPLSSPDVLTLDGANDQPPTVNPPAQITPAKPSDSAPKATANPLPTSSLTTLPQSTQSSGSKRRIKNGEEVVMDSQSSDSSEDLVDMWKVLAGRRGPSPEVEILAARPLSGLQLPRQKSDTYSSRSNRTTEGLRQSSRRSLGSSAIPKPPSRKYKFSLNSLVKSTEKAARAESKALEYADKLEREERAWDNGKALDESYLASVVERGSEEEGKAQRVVQAISRTDAMEQALVWHFFDQGATTVPRKSFPYSAVPSQGWISLLKDPNRCQHLLLSGFASRMTSIGYYLPVEILEWLLSELCHEKRDELLDAYVDVIVASAPELRTTLTAAKIQTLFESLGAGKEAVEAHAPIHPESTESGQWIPPQLKWLLRCLQGFSRWLSQETRFYILHVLIRLLLDEGVRYDGEYQLLISETITFMVRDIPEEEADVTLSMIGRVLYESVPLSVMRERIVMSLPSHTPTTHLFRRRLAFAFALETPKHMDKSMTSRKLTDHVLLHLAKSHLFRILPDTDYRVLAARFTMLDIAIDASFSDFSWLQESTGDPEDPEEVEKRKAKEKKFNAGIDMLAQEILEIMARIVDSGLTSLRRTEAKAAAQKLHQRLEYAVRTKEKPAKDWFGEKDDVVRREFMQNWFRKPEKGDGEAEGRFEEDDDGRVMET